MAPSRAVTPSAACPPARRRARAPSSARSRPRSTACRRRSRGCWRPSPWSSRTCRPPEQAPDADDADDGWLYGIYEGTPLIEWGADQVPFPNVITLFRIPLQEDFPDPAELALEIARTVVHELAHHAGIDDDRLARAGLRLSARRQERRQPIEVDVAARCDDAHDVPVPQRARPRRGRRPAPRPRPAPGAASCAPARSACPRR